MAGRHNSNTPRQRWQSSSKAFDVVMLRVLKQSPALDEPVDAAAVGRLAQAMLFVRVGFAAAPALWGFALSFVAPSRTPLLVGLCCTLILFALWWPGERFVEAVRRRVEPTGAAHLVDGVLRGRDPSD